MCHPRASSNTRLAHDLRLGRDNRPRLFGLGGRCSLWCSAESTERWTPRSVEARTNPATRSSPGIFRMRGFSGTSSDSGISPNSCDGGQQWARAERRTFEKYIKCLKLELISAVASVSCKYISAVTACMTCAYVPECPPSGDSRDARRGGTYAGTRSVPPRRTVAGSSHLRRRHRVSPPGKLSQIGCWCAHLQPQGSAR